VLLTGFQCIRANVHRFKLVESMGQTLQRKGKLTHCWSVDKQLDAVQLRLRKGTSCIALASAVCVTVTHRHECVDL
jgi:hypothetical protein